MSKISITNIEEAPWLSQTVKDGLTTGAQIVGDVEEGDLCAFIMHLAPGYETELHSHSEDEVIYVLDGEIRMGRRVLGPQSIIVIRKDSQYKFTVGDEGVRFLNVRPGQTGYQPVVSQK
jgi:quercetin dioxygenase-like cupin family protein